MLKSALCRFTWFLRENYPLFTENIRPQQLNKEMMQQFVDFLQSKSKGTGAVTMYKRFKKVVNYALRQGVIAANPCAEVPCRTDNSILRKDILTLQEMSELINTPYEGDEDVRRAFIFCLYTGLRFCDVKD